MFRAPLSPSSKKLSLAELLVRRRTLPRAWAVDIALDICEALSRAHAEGVVHGSLGPRCIRVLLDPKAGPRVVEIFALRDEGANIFEAEGGDDFFSALDLDALAAPGASAPSSGPDPRRDVWALGILLHRMLAGVPPLRAAVAAGPKVLLASPPLAPVSRPLARIVVQCLADDPNERPESVRELAEKLAGFASEPRERFAALAAKRVASARVESRVSLHERRAALEVLDRLDDGALMRERWGTTGTHSLPPEPVSELVMARLARAADEATAGLEEFEPIATAVREPAPEEGVEAIRPPSNPRLSAWSIAPVVFAPEEGEAAIGEATRFRPATDPRQRRHRRPSTVAAAAIAAAALVGGFVAVTVAMRSSREASAPPDATLAAPQVAAETRAIADAGTPQALPAATTTATVAMPIATTPPILTPTALPDAPLVPAIMTPHALPDAPSRRR